MSIYVKALGPVPGAQSGLSRYSLCNAEPRGHAQAQELEGLKFKSQLCLFAYYLTWDFFLISSPSQWDK